jgi:hypothetical protein
MKSVQSFCATALLLVSAAGVACDNPALIEIPAAPEKGRKAERLLSETHAYLQGMVLYTECLKTELASIGESAPELQRGLLVARNNRAVAEVEMIVKLYETNIGPLAPLAGTGN